jgi:hypothetical protein
MVVPVMVMVTMCRKSGARAKDNHGEQQSFFHAPILAIAGARFGYLFGLHPSR